MFYRNTASISFCQTKLKLNLNLSLAILWSMISADTSSNKSADEIATIYVNNYPGECSQH